MGEATEGEEEEQAGRELGGADGGRGGPCDAGEGVLRSAEAGFGVDGGDRGCIDYVSTAAYTIFFCLLFIVISVKTTAGMSAAREDCASGDRVET